jgi:hypothetical protein
MQNLIATTSFLLLCLFPITETQSSESQSWTIPAAGNSFQSQANSTGRLRNGGAFLNLTDADTLLSLYFHVDRPAKIEIDVEAKGGTDATHLVALIGGEERKLSVRGDAFASHSVGTLNVQQEGYVRVDLRKQETTSSNATVEIKGLVVRSNTEGLQVTCVATNEGNMFYWGRRGPSVHLSYQVPRDISVEYGYSEITVADGEDPIGSYFMANGFGEGYFGIQVNSATERRVLFSVWSPFQTDDPRKIPEDQRVRLLAKGPEVKTGEFGNEGSGGQSYLIYPWQAGRTYRFLTRVAPEENGSTVYTSWFGDKEKNEWRLIASFRRPKTNTYLRGFHSFLENFDPSTGDQMRRGQHGNIWVRDKEGMWHECLKARFSVDATGQGKHRLDFDGGSSDSIFYLRNCGFFNGTKRPGETFERQTFSPTPPEIDLQKLPLE